MAKNNLADKARQAHKIKMREWAKNPPVLKITVDFGEKAVSEEHQKWALSKDRSARATYVYPNAISFEHPTTKTVQDCKNKFDACAGATVRVAHAPQALRMN